MAKAKILVVDNEVQIREFLHTALTMNNYESVTVPTADQAFEALTSQSFDLAILDVNMPGESGTSLLKKIRKAHSKMPVVIYSGYLTPEIEKELRESGANEVLVKTEGIAHIMKQIGKILEAKDRLFYDPRTQKEKTVLVVDNEKTIRDLLKTFLVSKDYKVFEADGGEKAIEIAKTQKFSVVLLDVQMKGINGLETLKKLLEINPKLGVVMVTGEQDDETVKQAMKLGAYGYILKPFDFLYLELVVLSKLVIAEGN